MTILKSLLITSLLIFASSTFAAGSEPAKSDPPWLTEANTTIKSGNFDLAISQLQVANQKSSADWNNLMGYSMRKKQPADLASAQEFYEAALKIDPAHRGALEYYGELKLINNDLTGAEALLARLDKACFFGCEEYRDLKKSVQDYKNKK